MEYSSIILEMLERIKALEEKVKELEGSAVASSIVEGSQKPAIGKVSAKYRKLSEYLLSSGETQVILSYAEIEKILGFALPATAKEYKNSFWANTTTHSYARSWMTIGYRAHIDVENDEVTFYKELV